MSKLLITATPALCRDKKLCYGKFLCAALFNCQYRTCKLHARRHYESMKILKGYKIHDITRELTFKKNVSYEAQSIVNQEHANFVQEGITKV